MNIQRRNRAFENDDDWSDLRVEWNIRADTTYLNHGSFGPSPRAVRYVRRKWIENLDEQPMDFYVRELEGHLHAARESLAEFVGTAASNLVFVDNATYGMNVVASSFELYEGDEVLVPNHEYGAVLRIWDRVCDRIGAKRVEVRLPERITSATEVVEALLSGITERTKVLVISHITSATAMIMPVAEICKAFQQRGISVCVDGPHAPAQIPFRIDELGCAFYTASCHKWLCAPLGSGFLYVNPYFQPRIEPPIKSWGRLLPAMPERWDEEFTWLGTRDPSPYLSIPTAIEFMKGVGLDSFRGRCYWLAEYAEAKLFEAFGTEPIASREAGFYGTMAHVPLPPGDWSTLQAELWDEFHIEVPIINFEEKWYVRVSCHLYNTRIQIDHLVQSLEYLINRPAESVEDEIVAGALDIETNG